MEKQEKETITLGQPTDHRQVETKRLGVSAEDLEAAAAILRAGGLVAFPTETVYGLGANALDPEAVRRIYAAKGRPADNPSIVHISAFEELSGLAAEITEDMKTLADAFWPGPMTMIVRRLPVIPDVTTGGLDTVGIRMPETASARELIRRAGVPVAAPSANISGRPSPTAAQHVLDDFDGRIEAVIDGGSCRVGIESTVVDMTSAQPMILRPGILTQADLEAALGKPVLVDPALTAKPAAGAETGDFKPKAPGQKYRHYAPRAEMIIYDGAPEAVRAAIAAERAARESRGQKVRALLFDREHEAEAARDFFAALREADREGADVILAAALPEEGIGFSVMNRMLKSAGFHVVKV